MIAGLSNATVAQATSTALTSQERSMLAKVRDPAQKAQMEAQLMMQKHQNIAQFISNVMRIKGDTSKAIISNTR